MIQDVSTAWKIIQNHFVNIFLYFNFNSSPTSTTSELVLPSFSSIREAQDTDLYVQDVENNGACMVGNNETKSQHISIESDEDGCNDDCDDPVTMFAWNDPHLKHTAKGADGNPDYIMNCLDCRVEKAIKDVQEEMKESLSAYYKSHGASLAVNNSENISSPVGEKLNHTYFPDVTLTPRQKRRRRRKFCKKAIKEDRKKRRKVIEDLIRLEGELNSGMGTYAMSFDTDSQPVN